MKKRWLLILTTLLLITGSVSGTLLSDSKGYNDTFSSQIQENASKIIVLKIADEFNFTNELNFKEDLDNDTNRSDTILENFNSNNSNLDNLENNERTDI
ncbi:MAG: hypothetical protein LBT10_05180 [Methanobrevibacter sp.]|jgi:hypothetical protein|nr:hypothetical protein [Methanobrevibacter sp.]